MTEAEIAEKMMILREGDEFKSLVLPSDLSPDRLRAWIDRFAGAIITKSKEQQKKLERFEGRTFRERWARPPVGYFRISGNSRAGDFSVGQKVVDLIENEGRQTIDELCKEIGAIDQEPLTVMVNIMLRRDHYLQEYTEVSGIHTLELVTEEDREKMMAPPLKEDEKKRLVEGESQ